MDIEDLNTSAILKDLKSNFWKIIRKTKQKYYQKVINGLNY